MIRKTLLVISLLLLVGTVGLWVRSYSIAETFVYVGRDRSGAGVAYASVGLRLELERAHIHDRRPVAVAVHDSRLAGQIGCGQTLKTGRERNGVDDVAASVNCR